MAYSKVILNGTTLMDVTQDTVTANTLLSGETATRKDGISVTGSYVAPTFNTQTKSKTYTPTETSQTEAVSPDSGYDGLSAVNITVSAIDSSYVGSDVSRRSSTDLTASGSAVTVPAGYYASAATKAVSAGTAGTPTATKGTVSNYSISVTPSVLNTAGYISGGTNTGTAATVSAAELVSGTITITTSGITDVTNYASASVTFSTIYTGSSAPSSSVGVNGDVYLVLV